MTSVFVLFLLMILLQDGHRGIADILAVRGTFLSAGAQHWERREFSRKPSGDRRRMT